MAHLHSEHIEHTEPASAAGSPFLTVDDLKVHFPTPDGVVKATDGLSFTLARGSTLGIVGESGSGKSVSSSAILGLHRGTSARVSGRILLDGTDLLAISDEEMRRRRGKLAVAANSDFDLPTLVGLVLLLAAFVIIANIIVDLLYAVIDPRVRLS